MVRNERRVDALHLQELADQLLTPINPQKHLKQPTNNAADEIDSEQNAPGQSGMPCRIVNTSAVPTLSSSRVVVCGGEHSTFFSRQTPTRYCRVSTGACGLSEKRDRKEKRAALATDRQRAASKRTFAGEIGRALDAKFLEPAEHRDASEGRREVDLDGRLVVTVGVVLNLVAAGDLLDQAWTKGDLMLP